MSNLLFLVHGKFGADGDKLGGIGRAISLTLMEVVKFFPCCCFGIWVVKCCLKGVDKFLIGLELYFAGDGVHVRIEPRLSTSGEMRSGIRDFAGVL